MRGCVLPLSLLQQTSAEITGEQVARVEEGADERCARKHAALHNTIQKSDAREIGIRERRPGAIAVGHLNAAHRAVVKACALHVAVVEVGLGELALREVTI